MLKRLFAFIVGLVLLGGFTVAEAGGKKGELVLRVSTNVAAGNGAFGTPGFDTFDQTAAAAPIGGAAFYVSGDICAENAVADLLGPCTPIGTFHCWGWLIGPDQLAAVVSREYDLDGRGKIQVQGFEDDGPRAVTGGTGDFRNVRGEATGFNFDEFADNGNGEFIVTFKLKGAKK